jgi:broad specificity phosphatase PhoE
MVPLAKAAAALVRQLGSVRYEWIPRAMNSHADRLANEAMDRQAGLAVRAVVAVPAGPAVLKGFDGDPGDPVSLYWVRHGQTEHSAAKLFSGSSDPELTQLGQRQADAVAERLAREGVTVLLTSPLCRARSTAAAIEARTGLTAVVDERLRETDFGAWEGLSFTEVRRRDGEHLVRWYGDPTLAPPGGESFAQTEVRVRELWQDVVRAHPGARVALVSHVGPIKTAIGIALRAGPSTMHRLHLDLASLCVTEAWPDGHTVLQMANDHAHLWGTHAADPG